MIGLRRPRLSSGRVALIISVLALVLALVGTAFSVGSRVPGKGGVKASDIATGAVKKKKIAAGAVTTPKIADGAVTTPKIADKAVTSGKFFLSVVSNQNVGNVGGGTCSTFAIATPGIQATDHVLVTPPPGWTDTFTLVGDPNPAAGQVIVQFCNTFPGGGAADPDGGGGPYKVLVIR
jgi:hypothetical protein